MSFCFLAALSALAVVGAADELADDVVKWVVQKGGFFHPDMEIRGMDPNDPTSPLGIFAKKTIQEKEKILFVPHGTYIIVDDPLPKDETDEEYTYYYRNYCKLSKKLKAEMKKGDASAYAPYIRYVQHQQRGQLPATWSRAGKDLLRSLLPAGHDGVDWIDQRFKQDGCISTANDDENAGMEEHAVALVIQRGYDQALIPLWDMFNHRNGYVNTQNDSIWANDGLVVRAARAIQAGEEIYATYDKCVDCGTAWWYWGTPEILRDFGFVEDIRQRWVFYDQSIWFELDYNQEGELEVIWDTDDPARVLDSGTDDYDEDDEEDQPYGVADDAAVAFMKRELDRLKSMEQLVAKKSETVPKHEYETIVRYHRAAIVAMSMGIESATSHNNSKEGSSDEL